MSLKLYNSLSSKKEVFKSISDKIVKTYGCGPTVYNDPHICLLYTSELPTRLLV